MACKILITIIYSIYYIINTIYYIIHVYTSTVSVQMIYYKYIINLHMISYMNYKTLTHSNHWDFHVIKTIFGWYLYWIMKISNSKIVDTNLNQREPSHYCCKSLIKNWHCFQIPATQNHQISHVKLHLNKWIYSNYNRTEKSMTIPCKKKLQT